MKKFLQQINSILIPIMFTVIISLMSFMLYQIYNFNASNMQQKEHIKTIDSCCNEVKETVNDKNKNTNLRIDNVVDKQGEINDKNTQEHKKIIEKLDKIFYYLKYHTDFSDKAEIKTKNINKDLTQKIK